MILQLGGNFKDLFSHQNSGGSDSQVDEHMFQKGWLNHHLVWWSSEHVAAYLARCFVGELV